MFLICGDNLFDMFMQPGAEPSAADFAARAGGSPFNVAIGMRRLEGAAGYFSALSTDPLGRALRTVLENERVDLRHVRDTERKTTLSLVTLDAEGVPAYTFYSEGAADTGVTVADLPELDDDLRGIHFGSYSIVLPPTADALAELASRADWRLVSLDPNIRPTVEPDMSVWRERVETLMEMTDVLKISTEDLGLLYPGVTPAEFAIKAFKAGVDLVAVTDGGERALGWTSAGVEAEARPPQVDVIDTVGAGDTFMAALLTRLSQAQDMRAHIADLDAAGLEELLAFCARAAAITCTRQGADLPRLSDL
ncbi:carbohydrate kinase [Roseobacter sp. HKCCA0434]|uniref:carbohydrate kinase family protein n=1 Tax=Roseobacter sp. HKCCA0434 TaxID=3079297 RepID=UPI002905D6A6|nr:carbohydrate kinase [Roseobacter sp. HKCCA0434]